ncbi:Di-copper centre-containing protein [Neofusicoccum parvum]|nr:Di-copper centre-containing protein [Neofusicoccum parvum]
MLFLAFLVALEGLAAAALGVPTNTPSKPCINPPVRKEWRELSLFERRSYIDAVFCLTRKPAVSGLNGTINRFDDHHAVHSDQTPSIHWVGHFALWHRYFVATYERALREECGYRGAQPYWNWSTDASADQNSTTIFETEVFDALTGFGGNGPWVEATAEQNPLNLTGRTGGGCVADGPFAYPAFRVNVGLPGCLKRDFTPWVMNSFARQELVDYVVGQPDYASFAYALENIPSFDEPNIHGSGHFGVGGVLGTIGDAANSPGDPLFYLHHGNLDRILWEWQKRDLPARYSQVGGPVEPFDYSGPNVTLDFEVNIGRLAGNATLKDLLDIQGGTLCYGYE